jgi:acetyl esterase/lipase
MLSAGPGRGVVAALAAATMVGVSMMLGVPTPQQAEAQAAVEATVEPSSGLTDGDLVTITVSGLRSGSYIDAVQCVADPTDLDEDCDLTEYAFGIAGPDGTANILLRVDAVLATGYPGSGESREVDCRSSACVVGLMTQGTTFDASVALSFDPGGSLAPPPTVSVTPDSNLDDLASVTVEASGLVWNRHARIMQCVADPAGRDECDWTTGTYSDVSDTGSLTVEIQARSLLDIEGREPVDCRDPGACVVAVTSDDLRSPAKSATAPVVFAPDAEVATPTLSVAPDSGLVDGQVVTLSGGDYPVGTGTGTVVDILQCTSQPSYGTCQWIDWTESDSAGDIDAEVPVHALLPTADGEVDCRTSAEPCQLVAGSGPPWSIRSGRVDLDLAADGPLLPRPSIEVSPSTGLTDGDVVTVTGTHFTPSRHVWVQICVDDDAGRCAHNVAEVASPSSSGTFTLDLTVSESFETWDGDVVDCLATPCAVSAEVGGGWRAATAPITFAAPPPGSQRYLDAVFDDVEVTEGIAYRTTTDAHGAPVDLTLDLYQPAGDTADQRPVVVWSRGGWFGTADDGRATAYAEEFARRGYVVAVIGHRTRPELGCCPTRDALGIAGALSDATADVEAGVAWLRDHAEDHRLDPRAIVAGGTDGGAAVSYGLAYPGQGRGGAGPAPGHPHEPGGTHDMGTHADDAADADGPAVAAALPVSGVSVGEPAAGAPPVLAFHGENDLTAPAHLSTWTCSAAEAVGARCDVVVYAGAAGEIGTTKQRDIVRRSTAFLAEVVLGPLGYLDPAQTPAPTTTATTTTTTTTVAPPAADGDAAAPLTPVSDRWPGGDLARTGLDGTLSLARAGAVAMLLGAGLLLESRRRRRDRGVATEGG